MPDDARDNYDRELDFESDDGFHHEEIDSPVNRF